METEMITLARDWTYRTPLTTIDYPAGVHDVLPMIAVAAREAGAVAVQGTTDMEISDGDTDGPATPRKARAAYKRKG